jgi:hypothetical protein
VKSLVRVVSLGQGTSLGDGKTGTVVSCDTLKDLLEFFPSSRSYSVVNGNQHF